MKATKLTFVCFLFAGTSLFPADSHAHPKQATVVANCRSLFFNQTTGQFNKVRGIPQATNFVTTFDGASGVPRFEVLGNGSQRFSGELRPSAGQPGVYQADYITYGPTNILEYGSFTLNLPTTDADSNGLPDICQLSEGFPLTFFTGSHHADWCMYFPPSSSITGRFSRNANTQNGFLHLEVVNGLSTSYYNGTWGVLHISGSATYQRGLQNTLGINLTYSYPEGRSIGLSASTGFVVTNSNQIVIPQFQINGSDDRGYLVLTSTLTRSGNKYIGNLAFADGDQSTSWQDYRNWVIEIIDLNDSNGNGVPDLSDLAPLIESMPQSQDVDIGLNALFTVVAMGTPPLSFQWQFNGTNIAGATGDTYNRSNVQTNDAGNYTVVVSNAAGVVTSSVAVLTVTIPLPGALDIANAGFEDPVTVDGQENGVSGYSVPGWVEFGEVEPDSHPWAWGVYNPDVATIPAEAHGGENILNSLAYLPGTQYVEQQLNAQLALNTRYTLSAWAADPDPKSPLNSVRLMLFAGSTLLGSADIQPQVADTWTNGNLVIETGREHPQLGQTLKIRIMWGNHASYRVFVDDVSLTALPAEPLVFNGITRQGNGNVLLNMSSPTGKNVTIYASPDLLNWLPLGTLTNTQGTLQFIDAAAGSFEQRFYKAVAQ